MPFYTPGRITVGQLKHLIAIYDGEIVVDLDSNKPVHSMRSKLTNPIKEHEALEFIVQLKGLISPIDMPAPEMDEIISEKIINILQNNE